MLKGMSSQPLIASALPATVKPPESYYTWLPLGLILLCLLPMGLHLAGFALPSAVTGDWGRQYTGYSQLSGAFVHTILEWSAFCLALFIGLLALAHYQMTRNLLILTIGGGLLVSGLLDAMHALVSVRLLGATGLNESLIPLTWTFGRLINSLFMGSSVLYLLATRRIYAPTYDRPQKGRVLGLGAVVLLSLAACLMIVLAHIPDLPPTIFNHPPLLGLITRPYDLIPLVIYLIVGIGLYPRFYKAYPSVFSFTLMLSLIPDSFTQLYMALGSEALFDSFFYVAHALKILAYALPLSGLILDYLQTHLQQKHLVTALQQQVQQRIQLEREVLEISHREQERIGKDLHDSLGQLLTGAALLGEGLRRQTQDETAQAKAAQITGLLNDAVSQIRNLSRILAPIDLQDGDLPEALRELTARIEEVFGFECRLMQLGSWPEVPREQAVHLYRIVQEATHNSVKHSQGSLVEIRLAASNESWTIEIRDNGRGIFWTGSQGLGLQLMQSRADSIGAELKIESAAEGVTITCKLPRKAQSKRS